MKRAEYREKIEQVRKLILASKTGSPAELAEKLFTSERTARRLVEELKEGDSTIWFNRKVNSYTTDNPNKLKKK
ncbi:MAG: hypothetical protein ACJ77K_03290 [Bacteroidia bacterium]|jgi:hypothetical protein